MFELEDEPGVELFEFRLVGREADRGAGDPAGDVLGAGEPGFKGGEDPAGFIIGAEEAEAGGRPRIAFLFRNTRARTEVEVGLGIRQVPPLEQPVVLESGEQVVVALVLEAHRVETEGGLRGVGVIQLEILHRVATAEHELVGSFKGDRVGGGTCREPEGKDQWFHQMETVGENITG